MLLSTKQNNVVLDFFFLNFLIKKKKLKNVNFKEKKRKKKKREKNKKKKLKGNESGFTGLSLTNFFD